MADGTIERYKARLTAHGYTPNYGVDYFETFYPVAQIETILNLFYIVANKDWPLHQFNMKNAFLHGKFEEEVYMKASSGNNPGEGCKLMSTPHPHATNNVLIHISKIIRSQALF